MTATILRPQLRQALLRQLQKDSKRKRNIVQQGFTLVELMIVIVIVGILSAIAIPNFFSATDKAKATEAKTQLTAILKQGQAYYTEDPTVLAATMNAEALTAAFKSPTDGATKFNYSGTFESNVFTVTAKANTNFGTAPTPDTIAGCVNVATGKVAVNAYFSTTAPTC
jgi:type IV pilus assembly protein PilA